MTFSLTSLFNSQTKWLEAKQNNILSAASVITSASMLSAMAGLIVKRVLNFYYYDSAEKALDTFWLAFQIPDLMFQLIVIGALSAAFIPIFTEYKKKNSEKAFFMSSIMMNILLLVFIVIAIFVYIFAKQITILRTGSEISPEQINIIVNLTRIMLWSQFFFAISNFMTGILQSFQRFIIPAIAPLFYNFGILIGVFLFSHSLGIYAAGLGVLIGAFLHMSIQLPLVFKLGFKYNFSLNIKYPGIKKFFKIMPPRVISIGSGELRKIMLGFFTTSVGMGSYTLILYALTLIAIPIRFFGVPIGQASLPFLSEEAEEKDKQKFKNLVLQSLHQISFLTLPSSILLLILRIPVVRLVFGTKQFPWEDTILLGKLVAIIAISVVAQALVHLLSRAFYALKDTKTPLMISLVDLSLYLSLASYFVFISRQGLYGLALATTITAFVELILLLVFLNRKIKGFVSRALWVPQIKIISASFFMAIFLYLPYKIFDELIFDTSRTVELIGLTLTTSTIGLLVYIYFALLFDIWELKIFTGLISKFGPWKKTLSETQEILVESSTDNPDTI
ncbi:MAG: murein biosynthesis integral membrane protein MurJ [Patescibacteria group bacterium]